MGMENINSDEPTTLLDRIVLVYQNLTGKVIPETQVEQYKLLGKRAIRALENKLGWQFDRPDYINVLGVSNKGCNCEIDFDDLSEAPEKVGQYREFSFSNKDSYIWVDPFKKINAVYLCRVNPEGIYEHTTMQDVVILGKINHYSATYFTGDFGKYVQSCKEMGACQDLCGNSCKKCTRLLIDAEWVTSADLPDDLLYLICDYIDWLANGGISGRGVKKETVDGHSVEYSNEGAWIEPYNNPVNKAIIDMYTGPFGMVNRQFIY